MKYSSSLLKKFISINDTPENIAKNLILKTCEIEEIHHRNISESIVIGYVKSCEQHTDAEKLKVFIVDCWKKGEYQILCGGSNVAAGLYVPVALAGTVFEKAGITIEPRKMRGIESNGMICSKEELEILEDLEKHSIWSLTEDLEDISDKDLGTPLKEKFPRLEERVLEVDNKSLTNRPDLTWHFGVATELNAIYWSMIQDTWPKNNKVEKISSNMNHASCISFNKVKEYQTQCSPENIIQILENSTPPERKVIWESEGLNAYLLLYLKNISVQQASFFSRLQMIDMWSVPRNNRVDFSNIFMLIGGQPIHFFDADKVDGDIIVRNAKDGEKFVDLFETEHILKASDIVIADKQKILALAGVVGGLESGITEATKNILVEIANFDAVAVRKTGTRLSLRTDAELRFEKHINPRHTLFSLILFLDELKYYKKDLGNYEIWWLSYYINNKIKQQKKKEIEVNFSTLEAFILGAQEKWFEKKAKDILEGLWFNVQKSSVICPLRRSPDDLNIQEDIYEEVARIYGYDQIKNIPLLGEIKNTPYSDYIAIQRKLEDILVRTIGCNQTETYPRISEKNLQEFGTDTHMCYEIQNPVNPEAPYMRDDMVYGLLSHTAKNSKFFDQFTIFDIGKVWHKADKKEQTISKFASDFVDEETQLGIMLYQKNIPQRDKDPILAAKNIVRTIAKELELGKVDFEKTNKARFHPKKQATIQLDQRSKLKVQSWTIGFIGTLHPSILQNYKIGETSWVVYISLNVSSIIDTLKQTNEHLYTYESLQDQIVWRDLCFVVDANKDFGEVITAVKKLTEVEEVEVFDVYAGENIGKDKKSVSIKIKIVGAPVATNGASGTMTTEQINAVMNKAISAAESAGGSLRA